MRKLLTIIIWFAVLRLSAQYGNEWINFSSSYHKFPIYREGIYRIDSATLSRVFSLASVDPHHFQIFVNGIERPLFIAGEADNQVNTGDYIEFYAAPELAAADSLIYDNIKYLPNPYLPQFNDTMYAFITLNNSQVNKRYIIETDTTVTLYPPASYFYAEKIYKTNINKVYNKVDEHGGGDFSDPRYTQAEGFGNTFQKGSFAASNFSDLHTYTGSPLPFHIAVNYSGMSREPAVTSDHQVITTVGDANNNPYTLTDTTFLGFVPVRRTYTVSNQATGSAMNLTLNSVSAPFTFGNTTLLHYIKFYYPRDLDMAGANEFKLYADNGGATKSGFIFTNYNAGSGPTVFYDITNGRKIETSVNGTQVQVVVPNGAGRKLCYMASTNAVLMVDTLIAAGQNGTFTNFETFQGTKPYVLIYHKTLESSANSYANYRASGAGGSYNLVPADIGELYEQFGFGINKHPVAIRNFARYLVNNLQAKPRYIFLVGKSVNPAVGNANHPQNLIPTMGRPCSDNLLTAALTTTNTLSPEIPVGRLAAKTNSDVLTYLEKVQQNEVHGLEVWKKRVLHFVGGDDEQLATVLGNYMAGYESIIEDTIFGGQVYTFKKTTSAPIEINLSDSIKNMIKGGAALMNIFGHGSRDGFDQAIDDPDNFKNEGRYPFVIANSCYSGDIHDPGVKTVSERYVLAKQKGSIGFIATTSLGYDYSLNNYTDGFYRALSSTHYNLGVGDMVKEACEKISRSIDVITAFTGMDMTLHGDPAMKISNGLLPDHRITNNDVSFDLKSYSDSIGVHVRLLNLGAATHDSLLLQVERFFPNGDSAVFLKRMAAPLFRDSVKHYMRLDFDRGIGLNKFRVTVDYLNRIAESIETNNITGFIDLFVPGGDIAPVYPYKYHVVPKTNTLVLKASTTDPFAPLTTYRFQLDTCDKFANPLQSTVITTKGGVIEWTVNTYLPDSTVYYWRVSKDSTGPGTKFSWRESSFQTIGSRNGWGQAHFNQFKNDQYQFVHYKKEQRQFVFENNWNSIECRNGIEPFLPSFNISYYFNTIKMQGFGCAFPGWNFAIFDSISGQPQKVKSNTYPNLGPGPFNSYICLDSYIMNVYSFGSKTFYSVPVPTWKQDIENFINAIPTNQYVLAYTIDTKADGDAVNTEISTYSNALYSAFESIGAKNIRTTLDTIPYISFGRKGMTAGQGNDVRGINQKSVVMLTDSIKTRWNSGYMASETIGPSFKWNSLHWRVGSLDSSPGDTTFLKLVGIRSNGQVDTLATFPKDSMDVTALGQYADAAVHPYLRLVAFMKDNVHRTSPQLQRWQVLYDEAPECAINPLKGFASINDTLQEGDQVTFRFPIENIGTRPFNDSLVVTYWIEDAKRNQVPLPYQLKIPPFSPGQVLIDTVKVNSYQLNGNNALWIYVNPLGHAKYQKEQTQFNNIGRYSFSVTTDRTNPLLDVTFDGIRILNGDLVSARPTILISLKDENQYLALNDTSAFTVSLKRPDKSSPEQVYFGQGLVFTPASLPRNMATIIYQPILNVDGRYTLMVQARDRSKNPSGSQDYAIDFEVDNHPSITNVMNYPNPFSTSTRFVFTLTGSQTPEVFTIQILTITGKVVREITRGELGHLHVGRNITEYAWDGRDDYGDKLANGVYLYRVLTKLNGENIEKSASGADQFMVKDYGKMVIMR